MKTFVKLTIFTILFFLYLNNVKAQTLFEDTEGKSSVNLPIGGIARINTTDKSLKFAYYYNRSDKDVVFGLDVSGKSNNGIAPLVSSKKLSPEANFNFNIGLKNISTDDTKPSRYDYLNIKFGIGTAKYKLVDFNTAFEQQITSEVFTKINFGLSYNYCLNGNKIFGIYGGYNRTNNISSLEKITIKETTTHSTDSSGSIVRTSKSEYTVWTGKFKSIDQLSLYLDFVYIPGFFDNRVALSVYSRSGFNSEYNITNGGLGIYFNKKNEPLKIIGGIIYEFQDLFAAKDVDSSLGKRGTSSLVLGYNF